MPRRAKRSGTSRTWLRPVRPRLKLDGLPRSRQPSSVPVLRPRPKPVRLPRSRQPSSLPVAGRMRPLDGSPIFEAIMKPRASPPTSSSSQQAQAKPPDPFRFGWRFARQEDNGTGEAERVPLTPEDVLHPQEGDQIPENTL